MRRKQSVRSIHCVRQLILMLARDDASWERRGVPVQMEMIIKGGHPIQSNTPSTEPKTAVCDDDPISRECGTWRQKYLFAKKKRKGKSKLVPWHFRQPRDDAPPPKCTYFQAALDILGTLFRWFIDEIWWAQSSGSTWHHGDIVSMFCSVLGLLMIERLGECISQPVKL